MFNTIYNYILILDKKFNSPANALVHVRAHTQEKTYKCTECNLAFCDSSTLKKHIRTHTGTCLFKCYYNYYIIIILKYFFKGEKPYECHLCNKSFAQSGNLKRHLVVHEKYDVLQGINTPKASSVQEQESTPFQSNIDSSLNSYQNQAYQLQSNYPNQQLYNGGQSYY